MRNTFRCSLQATVHYNASSQVLSGQAKHPSVTDFPGYPMHQYIVIDGVEEFRQVHVHSNALSLSEGSPRIRAVIFRDTTAAFTLSPESWALICRATSPGDLALYAVSVRRLIPLRSSFLRTVSHDSALAFGQYLYLYYHRLDSYIGDLHPIGSRPCQAYTTGWRRRGGLRASAVTLGMNMTGIPEQYDSDPLHEWDRLVKDPYHSIELAVTLHCIRKYFPDTGTVLDAGGGPGRYSIELCRMGYDITLLDISSGCIAMAKEKLESEPEHVRQRLRQFVVGDVRDLSKFQSESFDAILCLDPLTYVVDTDERARALQELVRVGKGGAPIAVAVRGYLALLRTTLRIASDELLDESFESFVHTGNTTIYGTPCHFFRAGEIKSLAESSGLETLEMVGCEGLSAGLPEATNVIGTDSAKWQRWLKLVIETSGEPAVVEMAEHMLYLGRKPQVQ